MQNPHEYPQRRPPARGPLREGAHLGERTYPRDGGEQGDFAYHSDRGYQGDRGADSSRVYQGDRGYQGDRAHPGERWYQNARGYQTDRGYQVGNFPNLEQSNRTGRRTQDSYYASGPTDSTNPTQSPAARQGPGEAPGTYRGRSAELVGKGPKGYARSDERIHEEVVECLSQGHLDASGIEVAVKEGVVILQGAVASRPDRRLAEELVEHCRGIKDIDNRLKVELDPRAP